MKVRKRENAKKKRKQNKKQNKTTKLSVMYEQNALIETDTRRISILDIKVISNIKHVLHP